MVTARESGALVDWWPEIPAEVSGQLLIPLPEGFEVTDDWWECLRDEHRHVRIELTPERRLRVAMVFTEGSAISAMIAHQIWTWIEAGGGGMAFESAAGYDLPTGFRKYPDCSWVSPERLPTAPRPWRQKFDIVGDLIVEVRSPSQSVEQQRVKMLEWMQGGVRLGWLIDPFARTVWVYRANGDVEALDDPATLSGEDVCVGLSVDMSRVW